MTVEIIRKGKTISVTEKKSDITQVTEQRKTVSVTEKKSDIIQVTEPGVAGPPNTLTIGTVTTGDPAASITGIAPNQVLNLVLPTTGRHVHTQATPSTTWTINHVLGGYPTVSVVDSAKTVVYGETTYISTSQIVVNFSSAFSGYAYLT